MKEATHSRFLDPYSTPSGSREDEVRVNSGQKRALAQDTSRRENNTGGDVDGGVTCKKRSNRRRGSRGGAGGVQAKAQALKQGNCPGTRVFTKLFMPHRKKNRYALSKGHRYRDIWRQDTEGWS